jgi:hypothetical protein
MAWRHHKRERHGGVIFESHTALNSVIIDHGDLDGTARGPSLWFRMAVTDGTETETTAIPRCFARTGSTDTSRKIAVRQ